MTALRISCLAAACCALLTACGGGSDEPAPVVPVPGQLVEPAAALATLTAAQIDAATGATGLQALTGVAVCDVKVVALNYVTHGAKAELANSSGVMLVPQGDDPLCKDDAPLVAYAHGTSVDKPRSLANPADSETLMLAAFFAAQGFAVVATDYLGYAKSAYPFHPYLHADSEATSVLDSVRAARRAAPDVGAKLSGKVLFTGYSQGGHSSMSAQRMAEASYASEFDVAAGAHLAGPYNMTGAMQVDQAIAGYQFFVPFIITAWQKVYGDIYANASVAFKAPYAAGIDGLLPSATWPSYAALIGAGKLPGNPVPNDARDALMQPDFLDAMLEPASGISKAAAKNTLFGWNPVAPLMLCGGAGDPTVVPAVHQAPMMADFASRGILPPAVVSVDVDAQIQAAFGPPSATYYGNYHGTYEPPFCLAAARQFFTTALNTPV